MTATGSTNKKSFFISYIRYKLFRNKNLLTISALFSALCIPVFSICMSIGIGMINSAIAKSEFDPQKIYDMQNNIETIMLVGFAVALISALIVVVLTFVTVSSTFSYNLKKCDSDMYLSLPLTTSQRFFGDILTGAVISVLPMTIFGAISAIVMSASSIGINESFTSTYLNAANGGNFDYEISVAIQGLFSKTNNIIYRELPALVTYTFLALTATLIFMYLFCVLINSLTGKTTDYIVYTIVAVVSVSAVVASLCGMALNRVTNNMSQEEFSSVFMFASPAGMGLAFLASLWSSFNEEIYRIIENDGVYSVSQTDRYNMYSVFNTRNIIIMIIVFAVCLGLAYLATRLRKAEKTGSHFVFELSYHIISLSVIFAVFSVAISQSVAWIGSNARMTVIICIIISAVGYFFIELTHGRKLKKIWQSVLRYFGAILCTVLVCTVVRSFDIFGLEHYIPSVDNVKKVSISTSKIYGENGNVSDWTTEFKDKEIIKAVTDYHSFIVDKGYTYCNNDILITGEPTEMYPNTDNSSVKLSYELYDGRIITRRFGICLNKQNYGDYAKALYDMRCIASKTDEYVSAITASGSLQIKIFTKTGDIFGRMLNEDMNDKVVSAIGNDYKAGRNTGKLVAVVAINSLTDERFFYDISLEIRENCTETLALLNDEANSVSLRQSTIDDANEALKSYKESDEYSDEEDHTGYLAFLYSVIDLANSGNVYTDYVSSYYFISGTDMKATSILSNYAESEDVAELEKQFVMYDYYTDGLLADMDYVMLCDTGRNNSFGGVYFAPHENSKKVSDLILSIRNEFKIPIEQ